MTIMGCRSEGGHDTGTPRHIPGSHRWASRAEVPPVDELESMLVPFEAPAGSILAMEGRVWHTSGANVTDNEDRPLLFGYYTKPFVRPQWNFTAALRPEVQARFSPMMRYRLRPGAGVYLGPPPPAG